AGCGGLVAGLEGGVEILKRGRGGERKLLAKLEARPLVGEMSLIPDRPSSAMVVAVTECELSVLTRAQFQRLIAGDSIAAYKLVMTIAGVLAERLAKLDRKVLELTGHWDL